MEVRSRRSGGAGSRPSRSVSDESGGGPPDWMRIPFVHGGYRQTGLSVPECVHSAVEWNNETVNIWTHAVGVAFVLYFWARCATSWNWDAACSDPGALEGEYPGGVVGAAFGSLLQSRFGCWRFWSAQVMCLAFFCVFTASTVFHGFGCMNASTSRLLLRFDFVALGFAFWACWLPGVQFVFHRHRTLLVIYNCVAFGIWASGFVPALALEFWRYRRVLPFAYQSTKRGDDGSWTFASRIPNITHPSWRNARVVWFSAYVIAGLVPTAHALFMFCHESLGSDSETAAAVFGAGARLWRLPECGARFWELFSLMQYEIAFMVAGGFTYAFRFPERWWPGKFDNLGQSHHFWHVFTLAACAIHMRLIEIAFQWMLQDELHDRNLASQSIAL